MSKRTHEKELARARAKRQGERADQQNTRRMVAAGVVGLVAIAAVVVGFVLQGDDEPAGVGATDTPTAGATPTAGETGAPTPGQPTSAPAGATDAPTGTAAEPCPAPSDAPTVDSQVYEDAPEMQIDPEASYTATMATSCGDVQIELFAEDAPLAVNNFVFLAREDYYVGVPFHRVIDGFMVQGGDPAGTGCGQEDCANYDPDAPTYPGYTFEDELDTVEEYGVGRGMVAMANSGPDSNGSQFFVVQGDASHLTTHTVFGRVVEGMDVVDRMAATPVGAQDRPETPIVITDVTIDEA